MARRRIITSTFSVSTIEDGESAPYYFQEWFAWSNAASTSSVTTAPAIAGSWATSIPAQGGYAYLWRKSVRNVWNATTRAYAAEAAQYFRMSGTNGTSINSRGVVTDASKRNGTGGSGTGTAGTAVLTNGTTITMANGDCVVQQDTGHMWQWLTEGGARWFDLGQFQGEPGKTYYTHVVWATSVTFSGTNVQTIAGYVATKPQNDTTHFWMGVYVDENSDDPTSGDDVILKSYTWTYTKGVDGANAVVADLDNEMDGIQTDEKGKVLAQTAITTRARIYNGATPVTSGVTAAAATLCGVTVTPSVSNGVATYTWTIPTSYTFTNGKATVTLALTYGGKAYNATFTLMATMGTAVYNLRPSPDAIHVGRTDSGGYNPASVAVTCGYTKSVNGTVTSIASATANIDGLYRVFFRMRTRSTQAWGSYFWYGNSSYRAYLSGLDVSTYDQVEFILYRNTTSAWFETAADADVIDREMVPVLADGTKGDKGDRGSQGDQGNPGVNGVSPYLLTPQYSTIPVQCEAGGVTSAAMNNFAVALTLRQGATEKAIGSISGAVVEIDTGGYAYPTYAVSLGSTDLIRFSIPAGTNKASIAPLVTIAVKSGNAVLATCSIAFPIGQKGLPGDTEATLQPMRYYAGVWTQQVVASQYTYYYYTDTTAPIVKYGNVYYALNDTAASRGGIANTSAYAPSNETYWTEVSYRAAMWMEMLFANFARLGAAVFWGDFMFSAYGSFLSPGGLVENVRYDDADAISAVNATLGAGGDFTSCAWEPYYWVNLSTGKVFMENAVIRGLMTERFLPIQDDAATPQIIVFDGNKAHHASFEYHAAPKALLLPMIDEVGGIVYDMQGSSLLTATSHAFDGAGVSVRVVNQALGSREEASRLACAQDGVLLCADPRMFVPGNYRLVNGAWQYAPNGATAQGITPDYDGYFLWNGIYAKFILLPPGYMVRLTSLDNYDPAQGENFRYWYVEGAFDLTTVTMKVSVVPTNGNTCTIDYDGNINPGPHHANSSTGFLCPSWLVAGSANMGVVPQVAVNLYTTQITVSNFL